MRLSKTPHVETHRNWQTKLIRQTDEFANKISNYICTHTQGMDLDTSSDLITHKLTADISVSLHLTASSDFCKPNRRCEHTFQSRNVAAPTWLMCTEHFGMTSLLCRDIRSSSWLTRNEGGRAFTPPRGIVINSRQMGQRNDPVSRVCEAAILDRQCKHTVCEQGSSFGVCSPPSYMPANKEGRSSDKQL